VWSTGRGWGKVSTTVQPSRLLPLAPVAEALLAIGRRHGTGTVQGLVPGLVVDDPTGWTPASALTSGARIDDLLATAQRRWSAPPHVAAALAWKYYTYWVALPAVLGWATARRVPLVGAGDVLVRYRDRAPFLDVGLRRPAVAVLAADPLAVLAGPVPTGPVPTGPGPAGPVPADPAVRVVPSQADLLAVLRTALVDDHLTPVLDRVQERVRLGRRTLRGSLASGVAHALSRAADALPGSTLEAAETLLATLGVADLVDLTPLPSGELWIERRTCCLAFALPEPKICRGCCIR
jgi:hypothetical protein